MPANFQRFLPILLVVFVLLIVLSTLNRHHSSGLTSKELSQETIAAATTVDRLQVRFHAAHRDYTQNVADLLALDHGLGKPLGDGVVIALNLSTDKQTYYAQVASSVISLVRARSGATLIAKSCIVVKSSSGVDCPAPPATATTTGSTTTTTGSTTTSG